MNNFEKNLKKEAWKKDLSKIYLGLNDDKENKDEEFLEYNFSKREKKKDRLVFLKNFFGQLKSIKGKTYKKIDKSKEKIINLNKFEKYYYHNKDKDIKKNNINNEEINILLNKLKKKYSPHKSKEDKNGFETIGHNKINFLTEINNNNNFCFIKKINKIKNNIKGKNLFKSNYHLNELSYKHNSERKNNLQKKTNNKYYFPKIKSSYDFDKTNSAQIMGNCKLDKTQIKNIKETISDKNIFKSNKVNLSKNLNKNKTYLEQLKSIYKNDNKTKYLTINNECKNFEMPELLQFKEKPLFKKNNQIFFSALHYSKYEQMKEIKDKLTGKSGLMDKEVFTVYNKNI